MKGLKKKMLLLSGLFLISWLLFAQSCMSFRKSDAEAKTEFAKDHVALRTATMDVEGRHIHFAMTGSDSLPTLFLFMDRPAAGMLLQNT